MLWKYLAVLLIGASFKVVARVNRYNNHNNNNNNKDFDYLVLAMEWPRGYCQGDFGERSCVVPAHTTGWILHGLWPTSIHRTHHHCVSAEKFVYSKFKHMEDHLLKYWPNLLSDRSNAYPTNHHEAIQWWKYQYEKHGTCASTLPALSTLEGYFGMSITLLLKHNPGGVLGEVKPRLAPYHRATFHRALSSGYGVSVCMHCRSGMVSEVRVCLDRRFNLIDCPKCSHADRCGDTLYYPPLHSKDPVRPYHPYLVDDINEFFCYFSNIENKMHIFGLAFILFFLKISDGNGFCYLYVEFMLYLLKWSLWTVLDLWLWLVIRTLWTFLALLFLYMATK